MKEFYGYFDPSDGDERDYSADEFAELSRARGGTGVNEGLTVAPAGGLKVAVSPGNAFVNGYVYTLTDDGGGPKECALSVAGSADRIDRVVLRLDLAANARSITLRVKEGSPAAHPVPPALTKGDMVREISLCQVRVRAAAAAIAPEDITDERLDAELCGTPVPAHLQRDALDARYLAPATHTRPGAMSAADKGALDGLTAVMEVVPGGVDMGGRKLQNAVLPYGQTTVTAALTAAEQAIALHAPLSLKATLPASGWSATAPYTQTVSVVGLLATDTPLADVTLSSNAAVAVTELEAYGLVGRMDALSGALKATCYEEKPATALTIQLKVVR